MKENDTEPEGITQWQLIERAKAYDKAVHDMGKRFPITVQMRKASFEMRKEARQMD